MSSFHLDGGSSGAESAAAAARLLSPQFLLDAEGAAVGEPADLASVTPETRARLEALLEAAGEPSHGWGVM